MNPDEHLITPESDAKIQPAMAITSCVIHFVAIIIFIFVWFFTIPELVNAFEELEVSLSKLSQYLVAWNQRSVHFWWIIIPLLILFDISLVLALWLSKNKILLLVCNILVVVPTITLIAYALISMNFIRYVAMQ